MVGTDCWLTFHALAAGCGRGMLLQPLATAVDQGRHGVTGWKCVCVCVAAAHTGVSQAAAAAAGGGGGQPWLHDDE